MYRVEKVLNHNTVIGIRSGDNQEFLMIGKGIGFGKKVTEQIDPGPKVTLYSLQNGETPGSWPNPLHRNAWKLQVRF